MIASSAPNGSSSSSTGLSASSVRRNATRWRIPPDSFAGRSCSAPARPSRANSGAARRRASRRGTPGVLERERRVVECGPPRQAGSRAAASARSARAVAQPRPRLATDRDRARVGLVEPGDEREQRRLAGAAAADDPDAPVRPAPADRPRRARACRRARGRRPRAATPTRPPSAATSLRSMTATSAPFAGMTRIRFDGYTLGSALSAPHVGAPRYVLSQRYPLARIRCGATSRTGATGLEPATSGVTGRRSNQLNYAPGDARL